MLFKIVPEQRIGRFASVFQGDAFFEPASAAQKCAAGQQAEEKFFYFASKVNTLKSRLIR
jgi:hypothetical protein